MDIQSVIKDFHYKVLVKCMTYNQSQYIEDTLNGFVIQQTNFPVVYAIVDDASTDGEREIITSFIDNHFDASSCERWSTDYADFLYATHSTNKMCHFLICLLRWNHYATPAIRAKKNEYLAPWLNIVKYVALCEGDDYWTFPLKLQKQVDFLDEHDEYSICCHKIKLLYDNGQRIEDKHYPMALEDDGIISFTNYENLRNWYTETASVMFRMGVSCGEPKQYKYYRDAHMVYHILRQGKGALMGFCGAVYRKHSGGVYSRLNYYQRQYIAYNIYRELRDNNLDDKVINDFVVQYNRSYGWMICSCLDNGEHSSFLRRVTFEYLLDIIRKDGFFAGLHFCARIIKHRVKGWGKR